MIPSCSGPTNCPEIVTHDRRFIQSDDHVVEIEDGRIIA
jgi:ABC-type lipoprotein export system ATPase subunit